MDNASPSTSERQDLDEIALTDRELVSRYMRYSEGLDEIEDFQETLQQDAQFSSPVSTASAQDGDLSNLSGTSDSTTQTTPLRSGALVTTGNLYAPSPFAAFERVLDEASLPRNTTEYYTSQACRILQLGGNMFCRTGRQLRDNSSEVATGIVDLVVSFETSLHQITVEHQKIVYLQNLGPFTVTPTPEHSWVTYKQMSELVIKYAALPSKNELKVLEALAQIYDAYVYQPASVIFQVDGFGSELHEQLHHLYDKLMSLITEYRGWCKAMRDLNLNHMKPALRKVLALPLVMRDIIDFEAAKQAAEECTRDPANPGVLPVSDQVLDCLASASRRKGPMPARGRSGFRRNHTV